MPQDAPEPSLSARAEIPSRRRLLNNYIFQLINQVLRICSQILLVPLYLAAWGTDLYKDWLIVGALMVFLASCTLGSDTYFGNRFIETISRLDRASFRRELRTALFCTIAVGIAVFAGAVLVLGIYDLVGGVHAAAMSRQTIYGCVALVTLPVLFLPAQQMLRTIYRAEGEFSRGECVFAIYTACEISSVATILALKLPPLAVAACYLILPAVFTVLVIADLRHRYDGIILGLRRPQLAELKRIVPQSLLFSTTQLYLSTLTSGPLLVFAVLGVPALPVLSYTLVRTFTGLTRQASNQFAVGSGVEMARLHFRGEHAACHRLYHATGQVVTGLVGLLGGFTVWAAAPFLTLWTHGAVASNPMLVWCFLGGVFLAAPGQAALTLLNYTNHARPLAAAWTIQGIVGIALSAALVPLWGVFGAAVAFAFIESLIMGAYLPAVVQRWFGFSLLRHWVLSWGTGLLLFVWSALAADFAFRLDLGGIKGLLATGALWAVIAVPPAALLVLPARYRKLLRSFLGQRVARSV